MRISILAAAALFALASSANAATIPAGTASFAYLFNPTVNTSSNNGFYSGSGNIFTTASSGGYAGSNGSGSTSGSFSFSFSPGATMNASTPMVLTFGNFTFTVSSIETIAYSMSGGDTAISLFLSGTTSAAGYDATNASVTLQLNRTGDSAFSASATLSNLASAVPEPASWGLMLGGLGVVGAALRTSRRSVSVSYA